MSSLFAWDFEAELAGFFGESLFEDASYGRAQGTLIAPTRYQGVHGVSRGEVYFSCEGMVALSAGGGFLYCGRRFEVLGMLLCDYKSAVNQGLYQLSPRIAIRSGPIFGIIGGSAPIGTKSSFSEPFFYDGYIGDYSVTIFMEEFLIPTCDLLIGGRFDVTRSGSVAAALGGYALLNEHCGTHFGFQGTVEYTFRDLLFAGVYTTYDKCHRWETQGRIGITFEFGGSRDQYRCPLPPFYRLGNGPAVLGRCCTYETRNF